MASFERVKAQSAVPAPSEKHKAAAPGRLPLALATVGLVALAAATISSPSHAQASASQDWSPFVLVAGLLLIGLVADDDGLFAGAGRQLARVTRNGLVLFLGAALIVGIVTSVLNLDTAVAFLTPVLVYTARSRGGGEAPLLYGCLLLANASSLLLPGSNLTNLIVLGHLHLSGGSFAARTWAPALAAFVVTTAVIAGLERRSLRVEAADPSSTCRPVFGLGLVAVVAAAALVIMLRDPALPVAAVGIVVIGTRIAVGRDSLRHAFDTVGVPILVGLFGIAVALGTLGRVWSGPESLLTHLDLVGTTAIAAVGSVLVNNLPAASLFAARTPRDPVALLIGLNLGPNLCVSGSLAWILWLRAARSAGGRPSIAKATRLGVVVVPLSIAAALGALVLTGSR